MTRLCRAQRWPSDNAGAGTGLAANASRALVDDGPRKCRLKQAMSQNQGPALQHLAICFLPATI